MKPSQTISVAGRMLLLGSTALSLDICSDCPIPTRYTSPGVGFDLTINYGISAVYFPNGTIASVAKIEGSPAYKVEMRRMVDEACLLLEGGDSEDLLQIPASPDLAKYMWPAFLQKMSQYFGIAPEYQFSPILSMLEALKISTDSFISDKVRFVEVSIPASPSYIQDKQTPSLDLALRTIGLSRTNGRPTKALAAAARGIGIGREDSSVIEYILGVDYSRAGLMLTLDSLDRGVFEEVYKSWHPELGGDTSNVLPDYWKHVASQIGEFLKESQKIVDRLVFIGDCMLKKPEMMETLRSVLGKDHSFTSGMDGFNGLGYDPEFAAAIEMAAMSRRNADISPTGCTYAGTCKEAELYRDEL